jgi:hypothetical protein
MNQIWNNLYLKLIYGIVLVCVDCVLASPRITQANPGRQTLPRGGSVIVGIRANLSQYTKYLKLTPTLCR